MGSVLRVCRIIVSPRLILIRLLTLLRGFVVMCRLLFVVFCMGFISLFVSWMVRLR